MTQPPEQPITLPFSDKYSEEHARAYFHKHRDGLSRRLSHWRDAKLARKALRAAGDPTLVLDLPCGAGRFWPVLAEQPNRVIIAADNSAAMLDVARAAHDEAINRRVRTLQTSAFAIDLPDHAVDSVFCMRLLHHIGEAAHRQAMLREFHRVSRDTVILSLWVDGNYKAWKRKRLEASRPQRDYQNRFVVAATTVEREFRDSGFDVVRHFDFLPLYAMWRVYVLRRRTG